MKKPIGVTRRDRTQRRDLSWPLRVLRWVILHVSNRYVEIPGHYVSVNEAAGDPHSSMIQPPCDWPKPSQRE